MVYVWYMFLVEVDNLRRRWSVCLPVVFRRLPRFQLGGEADIGLNARLQQTCSSNDQRVKTRRNNHRFLSHKDTGIGQ